MLEIEGLKVEVDGKEILHGIDMKIECGETHVLFGKNGSGKTTLIMAIMGFGRYKVTSGKIFFRGEEITELPTSKRAAMGIGLMFQRPPTMRGVPLGHLLGHIKKSGEEDRLEALTEKLNMSKFLDRDVNSGFSGGEIKRAELLQLLTQSPNLLLLDEPESGVDLENMVLVGSAINELLQKDRRRTRDRCGLIITHTGYILDSVEADLGYIICEGRIVCSGNPRELLNDIRKYGFEECESCRM